MAKTYRGICHTTCYWLETLWNPGEVYEGEVPLSKHFSEDGKLATPLPPPNRVDDPRSNAELRKILKDKYGSTKPPSTTRKKLWEALREFEMAEKRDAATEPEIFTAKCGFVGKSKAGVAAHERTCDKCNEPDMVA